MASTWRRSAAGPEALAPRRRTSRMSPRCFASVAMCLPRRVPRATVWPGSERRFGHRARHVGRGAQNIKVRETVGLQRHDIDIVGRRAIVDDGAGRSKMVGWGEADEVGGVHLRLGEGAVAHGLLEVLERAHRAAGHRHFHGAFVERGLEARLLRQADQVGVGLPVPVVDHLAGALGRVVGDDDARDRVGAGGERRHFGAGHAGRRPPRAVASTTTLARMAWRPLRSVMMTPETTPSASVRMSVAEDAGEETHVGVEQGVVRGPSSRRVASCRSLRRRRSPSAYLRGRTWRA